MNLNLKYMGKNIILVDENDQQIGKISVLDAHLKNARRHRAVTVFIKNNKGELLITKRSIKKPLWPTYWDGAYSTHQRVGELDQDCCQRRLFEELGQKINLEFKYLFKYEYHIKWSEVFSEWEINHILIAEVNGDFDLTNINSEEISEYKWVSFDYMIKLINNGELQFAPWLKIAITKIQVDKKLLKYFS